MKIINECTLCDGTGEVEILNYYSGQETGHNTVFEGTDKYEPCPECQVEYYEQDENYTN